MPFNLHISVKAIKSYSHCFLIHKCGGNGFGSFKFHKFFPQDQFGGEQYFHAVNIGSSC